MFVASDKRHNCMRHVREVDGVNEKHHVNVVFFFWLGFECVVAWKQFYRLPI